MINVPVDLDFMALPYGPLVSLESVEQHGGHGLRIRGRGGHHLRDCFLRHS